MQVHTHIYINTLQTYGIYEIWRHRLIFIIVVYIHSFIDI